MVNLESIQQLLDAGEELERLEQKYGKRSLSPLAQWHYRNYCDLIMEAIPALRHLLAVQERQDRNTATIDLVRSYLKAAPAVEIGRHNLLSLLDTLEVNKE